MAMTIDELRHKLQDYINSGYYNDVAAAAREAQIATRDYISRTHPQTAFSGKQLGGSQIIIGEFDIHSDKIESNVYGNYFTRWYNTGAFGRVIRSGVRQGEKGPTYPSRGAYFENNKAAIEEYFRACLVEYLQKHISL